MKTIEVEETVKKRARVHGWALGGLNVRGAYHCDHIAHERDIPEDWPEQVKQACLDQILPNRELAEDEVRCQGGGRPWQLRWYDGERQCRLVLGTGWGRVTSTSNIDQASREWFAKRRPLAANETVSANGKRGTMSIEGRPWKGDRPRLVITWEDGQVSKHSGGDCLCQGGDWERRHAFYDKHQPVADNEFIDSKGDKWTFEMRDDGEADCVRSRKNRISTKTLAGHCDWSRAALAYRDRERARWTFELRDNTIRICRDGQPWSLCGGEFLGSADTPTWVREKARKMWEESQKSKRVEFEATANHSGYVSAGSNGFPSYARVRVTIEEVE